MTSGSESDQSGALDIDVVNLDALRQLRQGILKFQQHPSVFHEKLEWLLGVYQPINFPLFYSGGLWRAHKCSPEQFPHCDWLWAPPPTETKVGRLNAAGEPVLYASLHNRIALKEINAMEGDVVHVIKYDMNHAKPLRCCVVGEISAVYRTGCSWVSEKLRDQINGILNAIHQKAVATGDHFTVKEAASNANGWVYLDSFLAEILRDPEAQSNGYLLSSDLASLLFQRCSEAEAILYPSVPLESGKNVAIQLSAATHALKLSSSKLIRIENCYEYGVSEFEQLAIRNH